jgi:hypothetical protein
MKTEVKGLLDGCYHCNSIDISELSYGYVCRTCGTIQELIKFNSDTSVDKAQFQKNATSKTTIGNDRERKRVKDRGKIRYISKLNSIKLHKEKIAEIAFVRAKTILEKLGRSTKDATIILRKFEDISHRIRSKSKFRSPEKCIPCIIYFYYKEANIVIDVETLLEVSEISKLELNEFRMQMELFWPAYKTRDRKKYILTRIGGVIGYEKLYNQSKKILHKFWDLIKDSKDDIITGLVIGISITVSKCEKITLYSICKSLNITQSSLQKSIQTKLFDRLGIGNKVKGFKKKVEFLAERGFFNDI